VTANAVPALDYLLTEIAIDVGRLRRGASANSYEAHLLERIAACVHSIVNITRPTAGDLVGSGVTEETALKLIDRRTRRLAGLLGDEAREEARGERARKRLLEAAS
jgi:hypothetical protein